MAQTELDHWEVVSKGLSGARPVDGQTLASLAILGERLERLRRSHPSLSAVGFSPGVQELNRRAVAMTVG